jgi:hypothetical protein
MGDALLAMMKARATRRKRQADQAQNLLVLFVALHIVGLVALGAVMVFAHLNGVI